MSEAVAGLRERVRAHLDRGAPWDACDAFREAAPSDDPEWLFLGALAHARAGAVSEAHVLLDRAARASAALSLALHGEILALRGRLWKDALHRSPPGPVALAAAACARDEYRAAYALAREPFPGINAATLSMLLGDEADARALAGEVEATLAARGVPLAGWDLLTAAEAALLRGDAAPHATGTRRRGRRRSTTPAASPAHVASCGCSRACCHPLPRCCPSCARPTSWPSPVT